MLLSGRKILLGVSGGIAAYKACELVRELRRRDAQVRVMMTPSAREFVTPLTFAALSENPVLSDLFPDRGSAKIEHIDWSRWPEVIVVCPATATTLARLANGFADEPISATIRAAQDIAVVLCPAMNSGMWEDRAVQANIARLRDYGHRVVEPEFGAFATSTEGIGWGRLARQESILLEILMALHPEAPLQDKKLLVTAGRTDEYLDPVRMLTNPATGKMGFALAEAGLALGGKVTLIHGPTQLTPPVCAKTVPVVSASEMKVAVMEHYSGTDIVLMAAAVSDYRPTEIATEKLKKSGEDLTLHLRRNDDILELLGRQKRAACHVGFAVETENERAHAFEKLQRKKLDLVVLNNPKTPGAAFGHNTNQVVLLDAQGNVEELPLLSKLEVAFRILNKTVELVNRR